MTEETIDTTTVERANIQGDWSGTPLLDIPDDAVNEQGEWLWDMLTEDTGLTKVDLVAIQAKHMKKNGKPKNLYMVGILEDIFVVRELTQGDYRAIHSGCEQQEAEMLGKLQATNPAATPADIPDIDRNYIYWVQTTQLGIVHPSPFDPYDDDLPFGALGGLCTRLMEVSGAMEAPLLKKL